MPPIQLTWSRQFLLWTIAISLSSPLPFILSQPSTAAQPNTSTQRQPSKANRKRIFNPPPAPKTGRAGTSRGTATRNGSCPKVDVPLTALIPVYETEAGDRIPFGLTTSEHPTLWFYLPYEINQNRPAELRLETQDPGSLYTTQRTVLRITQMAPGIVGIPIPTSEAPLQVGQRHDWTFVVQCNPKDTSTNKYAEMSLERVAANQTPMQALAAPSAREQVVRYAVAGMWENSFTTLAQLRSQSPNDPQLSEHWADLFEAIGLPELASEPIVQPGSGIGLR